MIDTNQFEVHLRGDSFLDLHPSPLSVATLSISRAAPYVPAYEMDRMALRDEIAILRGNLGSKSLQPPLVAAARHERIARDSHPFVFARRFPVEARPPPHSCAHLGASRAGPEPAVPARPAHLVRQRCEHSGESVRRLLGQRDHLPSQRLPEPVTPG